MVRVFHVRIFYSEANIFSFSLKIIAYGILLLTKLEFLINHLEEGLIEKGAFIVHFTSLAFCFAYPSYKRGW